MLSDKILMFEISFIEFHSRMHIMLELHRALLTRVIGDKREEIGLESPTKEILISTCSGESQKEDYA